MDAERFVRQMLVAEIGEAGQRAICAGEAAVLGAGAAHAVAERYARAAGFGRLVAGPIADELSPSFVVEPSARAVLAGSRAALAAIVKAARAGKS
jgi:hypothetical protein